MSSMILTTSPIRQIVEVSSELGDYAGSEPRLMCGLDCASIVRCRNAEGRPLCNQLCPALAATRGRSGAVERVRVWFEKLDGELEEREASFQRVEGTPNGMVVAFFGEPGATAGIPLPAMGNGEKARAGVATAPTDRPKLRVVS